MYTAHTIINMNLIQRLMVTDELCLLRSITNIYKVLWYTDIPNRYLEVDILVKSVMNGQYLLSHRATLSFG